MITAKELELCGYVYSVANIAEYTIVKKNLYIVFEFVIAILVKQKMLSKLRYYLS